MARYDYVYANADAYCYPGTRVLRNKQGVQDSGDLLKVEREITSLKLLLLREKPMHGQYGFSHLKAIHRFIFEDIYEWAGKIRQGEFLMKGETLFCRGSYIEATAKNIFDHLASENKLRGQSKSDFIHRLAYYMGEVNALHPFREGNGRASREFFRQLSRSAGYRLDFGDTDAKALLKADIAAFSRDYEPLIRLLDKAVEPR